MKIKYSLILFIILVSIKTWGQNKEMRIGPGLLPAPPEPVFFIDGIKVPSTVVNELFKKVNFEIVDSVSIQKDSIFNCNGQIINLGIVKVFTKESENRGAKKILELTDNWLYSHSQTKLVVNNKFVDWDEKTYHKLTTLKPENIQSAKIKRIKRNDCKTILKIQIKE